MRVLALASQKGGSGKTTLSGHLAVQAQLSGAGPVCLIDIDPQGSLADWWNERESEMPAFAQTTVARLAERVSHCTASVRLPFWNSARP
jgi:chromosome partitioning protein